jgi:hypothetical protein
MRTWHGRSQAHEQSARNGPQYQADVYEGHRGYAAPRGWPVIITAACPRNKVPVRGVG